MANWNISEEAAALHKDALFCDMSKSWVGHEDPVGRVNTLADSVANGVDYVALTLAHDWEGLDKTIHTLANERTFVLANPEKYRLVETVDDILSAKKDGKLAIGFGFQGTAVLENDLNMVGVYHQLGVRTMLMAYNLKNNVGDGCMEVTDAGLTHFGVQAVQEMNRVGIIADGTHTGYRTTMDMMEVSTEPVVFSHSNAWGAWNHPRNIKDDQIKGCAKTGGVICVMGVGTFVGDNDDTAEGLLKHIDYIVELVGPEHVGIGLDFVFDWDDRREGASGNWNPKEAHKEATEKASGGRSSVEWLDIKFVKPARLPEVTDGMVKRGYSEKEIRGVLGENWLRVARQVWK